MFNKFSLHWIYYLFYIWPDDLETQKDTGKNREELFEKKSHSLILINIWNNLSAENGGMEAFTLKGNYFNWNSNWIRIIFVNYES